MPALSTYLSNELLDHILRGASYAANSTTYLALFSTTLYPDGSGSEVSGGQYARQAMTSGSWTTPSNGVVSNTTAINFIDMPAGNVVSVGIFSASSGGNLLYYGSLISTVVMTGGDTAGFSAGSLQVSME